MTDIADRPVTEAEPDVAQSDVAQSEEEASSFRSARGRFKIFRTPEIRKTPTVEQMADADLSAAPDGFDYQGLITDDVDEATVRGDVAEMVRAIAPGTVTTPLFGQRPPDGMSLVHVWFGPNFPLFRHSHPRFGDCLYYVIAGSVVLGNQVLEPGAGFFVPNGMPYKYKAGPEGVEVLEFRAGGGEKDTPGLRLDEPSIDSIRRITELAKAQHENWIDPPVAPGGPLYQPNASVSDG